MGIDFLELTIEIEERFGVALAPEDWPDVATVGGLVDALRRRLRAGEQTGLTLRAWFQIRELLREVAGDPDFRMRPSERLTDRLTPARRRELWRRLPDPLRGPPTPLSLGPVGCAAGLTVGAVVIGAIAVAGLTDRWWVGTFAVGTGAGLTAAGLLFIGGRLHTRPPAGYRTAGDLARRLVARTAAVPARGDPARGDPGEEAVRAAVRTILIEEVGIPAADITPLRREDRFVEDLGLD